MSEDWNDWNAKYCDECNAKIRGEVNYFGEQDLCSRCYRQIPKKVRKEYEKGYECELCSKRTKTVFDKHLIVEVDGHTYCQSCFEDGVKSYKVTVELELPANDRQDVRKRLQKMIPEGILKYRCEQI